MCLWEPTKPAVSTFSGLPPPLKWMRCFLSVTFGVLRHAFCMHVHVCACMCTRLFEVSGFPIGFFFMKYIDKASFFKNNKAWTISTDINSCC